MMPKLLYRVQPPTLFSTVAITDSCVVLPNRDSVPDGRRIMGGMWWPSSRHAAAEPPPLVAAVDRRLGEVTL
ncbi:DUF5994 family protein [Microtetraspora niveoalba]|uniref:DUF5994 family protein n=1 Tax=Microtetraspora niveoalba TaxID=46175 RepID=UPI00082AE6F0|nr:DUF5994 family protein [Microtetraspora niveoalba]